MRNKIFVITFLMMAPQSCNVIGQLESQFSKKKAAPTAPKLSAEQLQMAQKAIRSAKSYVGTPYLYGGKSRAGMDCSGLVLTAYQSAAVQLPRTSAEMATVGTKIELNAVQPGDLVFFSTGGKSRINHVGIVSEVKNDGSVFFIHSSSDLGVRTDNLSTAYYKQTFVKVMRPTE